MNTRSRLRAVALLGALALVACGDRDPVTPALEEELTPEDVIALDVLTDPASDDVALALVEVDLAGAARIGIQAGQRMEAQRLTEQARLRFRAARDELARGERVAAANEAREARRLVARAATTARGPRFMASLVERAEDLEARVAGDPEGYMNAWQLGSELKGLAQRARVALAAGDSARAGGLCVLAEQRHRQRVRRHEDPEERHERAQLAVELGATAVSLATRLLDERGAVEEQLRFLAAAGELQAGAEAALEVGAWERAVYLASLARWSALKAVVLPDGVTPEEARVMHELALALYEDAAAALEGQASALQMELLERARRWIEQGEGQLALGNVRGVGAFWRAAVLCTWLLG